MNSQNPPPLNATQKAYREALRSFINGFIHSATITPVICLIAGLAIYEYQKDISAIFAMSFAGLMISGLSFWAHWYSTKNYFYEDYVIPLTEQFTSFLLRTSNNQEYEVDVTWFYDSNKANDKNMRQFYVPIKAALVGEAAKLDRPFTKEEAELLVLAAMEQPFHELQIRVMKVYITDCGPPTSFANAFNKMAAEQERDLQQFKERITRKKKQKDDLEL